MARWTSWGALKQVFDERDAGQQGTRARVRELLSPEEYLAARRTVLNAHFTDPRLVASIWEGLETLGIGGGPVLEPGCGAGTFMGLAPEDARLVGIELDPVSADVARLLYPSAAIRQESFADTCLPSESFAAAVGNVPFGDFTLHDRLHNPNRHSIHNHFILKSLDLVRPGGLVAVLTSRYTLDAISPKARREMLDRADLVTAIRLPSGAQMETAGTEAVTDLVVLRRRIDGEARGDDAWLSTVPMTVANLSAGEGEAAEAVVAVNAWWDLHPELVLGTPTVGHGMYGSETLSVRATPGTDVPAAFATAWRQQAATARESGLGASEATAEDVSRYEELSRIVAAPGGPVAGVGVAGRHDGFLSWDAVASGFVRFERGVQEPVEVSGSVVRPLRALVELRDTLLTLLEAEAESDSTESVAELDRLRALLGTQYDAYVSAHGPINHVTVTTSSRLDKAGQPIVIRRKAPVMRCFDDDPFSAAVRALEVYDEESDTAAKAEVFTRRVVHHQSIPTHADSPADALAICLDTVGVPRLDRIAALLDVDEAQAREQLGDLVFDDPVTGRLVPRAEYLSGNVRVALRAAEEAALERTELRVNVEALREVVPRDLTPAEIKAQLGAVWIPAEDVQLFLREVVKDLSVSVDHPGGSVWNVRGGNRFSVGATQTWGTDRMNAFVIAERLMQQKSIVVTDTITDAEGRDRQVVNPDASAAAQDKAEALSERFADWVWEDPVRSRRLVTRYNETFNSIALRDYTEDGKRLRLPGLAATFTPHPHQRTAVARMIGEPAVGLYHGVGAGKTAAMAMGVSELRRLGLVEKPAVVVPNHMLEQFTREWMQLYPRARLLAAGSEDLRGEGRRRFVARAAMGDWDAVLMTHRAFEALPVAKATRTAYVEREIDALRTAKDRAGGGEMSRHTVRQIERALIAKEEQLKAHLDRPRDRGLTFEQSGIDYLVIDELHLFKNLGISSNISEVNKKGSGRAADLDMKLGWLREQAEARAAETGGRARVMTGATATPIANSVSEAWVMQKYLRPDLMEDAGITDFDSWAATFGTVVTELELTPEGGYRQKTRFARFDNLPELLRMWHVSADVKTSADLDLPIPALAQRPDGERAPEVAVVPRSPELGDFMRGLAERAEKLRSGTAARGKGEDNMLVVTSDGRKAALDLRMLDRSQVEPVASGLSKVDVIATRVHRIWQQHRDTPYRHPGSEEPHPVPGGFQLVFADLGTPSTKPEEPWSFYTELRDQLTAKGLDPTRIRFVQDANNDEKKARLFAACRDGQVDVLIGSTETMGVGTNVQTRLVALHHVDCPWRPADVEQREGRALRQGNQNDEIQLLRYVTEGSFDAFSWQTVERKQRFIAQMMNGSLEVRGAEDIAGGATLSYSEVKALASGDPRLLQRAELEGEVTKLRRLARAHARNQQQRHNTVDEMNRLEPRLTAEIETLRHLVAGRTTTHGDDFSAKIGARTLHKRADASAALAAVVEEHLDNTRARQGGVLTPGRAVPLGDITIGGVGFTLSGLRSLGADVLIASPAGLELTPPLTIDLDNVLTAQPGPLTRLENRVNALDATLEDAQRDLERARAERSEAAAGLEDRFARQEDLKGAEARLAALDAALARTRDRASNEDPPPCDPSDEAPAVGGREAFRRERERLQQTSKKPGDSVESPRHSDDHPAPLSTGQTPSGPTI